jgi:hypothetical protein
VFASSLVWVCVNLLTTCDEVAGICACLFFGVGLRAVVCTRAMVEMSASARSKTSLMDSEALDR